MVVTNSVAMVYSFISPSSSSSPSGCQGVGPLVDLFQPKAPKGLFKGHSRFKICLCMYFHFFTYLCIFNFTTNIMPLCWQILQPFYKRHLNSLKTLSKFLSSHNKILSPTLLFSKRSREIKRNSETNWALSVISSHMMLNVLVLVKEVEQGFHKSQGISWLHGIRLLLSSLTKHTKQFRIANPENMIRQLWITSWEAWYTEDYLRLYNCAPRP
jgi:hypothetical protein